MINDSYTEIVAGYRQQPSLHFADSNRSSNLDLSFDHSSLEIPQLKSENTS